MRSPAQKGRSASSRSRGRDQASIARSHRTWACSSRALGGGPGEVVAADAGLAQAEPDVEVVQGGQGVVAVTDRSAVQVDRGVAERGEPGDVGGVGVMAVGGSLATLLVADLTANTPLKSQAWTFASPRVGDAIFAARYGGLSTVSWRIYNQVDVVPYFPVDAADNYQPVTAGYAINSLGKARWSLGCAHALNTYLHVLSPATVPLDSACS